MVQILHGHFTSAFSLVYCDKFSHEKPSLNHESVPNLNFVWFFLFLGNVHTQSFGSMSHFLTLVGWQEEEWAPGSLGTQNKKGETYPFSALYL